MTRPDVPGIPTKVDRLTSIEQLLDQYGTTRDPRILRLAIELWNEVLVDKKRRKTKTPQIH